MMIALEGKVALVTGAGRGIGAAIALRLVQAGAAVAVTARRREAAQAVTNTLNADSGQALALSCDVTRFDDVAAAVEATRSTFGRLDILVNNAGGIEPIARIADSDPEAWSAVVDVNLKGVYHGLRAVLPLMLAQGSGTVVNISSGAATGAMEGWSHYCATKAAVLMLTRCADKEYRERGLRFVGLSPGTVATDMQVAIKASGINPVSRLAPSEHIPPAWAAEAVAWLCTAAGDPYLGGDFSLKTNDGRAAVGLPPLNAVA
jgi:NAD(P)-dependent dehydrogenase (short-subunit alcohol dehydrogenase family)